MTGGMKLFYDTQELLQALGNIGRSTLWRMEQRGDFPQRRQISPQRVGWLVREVEEWASNRPVGEPSPRLAASREMAARARREDASLAPHNNEARRSR